MSDNTFGKMFQVTTWGESHGIALGCVIDGCPAGIPLDAERDIQPFLDKRKPGTSQFVTQRREPDTVQILSGVFEGLTTGTPISLMIMNQDQRSKDYGDVADKFRAGHADYTYWQKYGVRDYRGGGRSSARETAVRVAAGAVARLVLKKFLGDQCHIHGAMVQMGDLCVDPVRWDWSLVDQNPFFCPDPEVLKLWEEELAFIRKAGSSIGAVIHVQAEGVCAGLGAPLYGKLDSDLASAMMSINAVKGVEIGAGFASAGLRGEVNADPLFIDPKTGQTAFKSNHAGGILGGISTGQPVVVRFVVKPTSSLLIEGQTINRFGEDTTLITKGRHDPCVGLRAVPVGEAMMACVLADHVLRHLGQGGTLEPRPFDLRDKTL
jgi:chorismate synthase